MTILPPRESRPLWLAIAGMMVTMLLQFGELKGEVVELQAQVHELILMHLHK